MLETLFGSQNRERVLQYILANEEGYAKEMADFYQSSLDPIQKQLERLENGGIHVSQTVGRTRVFMVNHTRYDGVSRCSRISSMSIRDAI